MSRAERRYRTENIVKKRIKKNVHWLRESGQSIALITSQIKEGLHHQWIKHTGVVCSCWMCSKADKFSKKDRVKNNNLKI